ncbi:MAG: FG-GAP-like repeat-containing protein, partial [Acidobacteriota bacterium]|nr:FG-GAP-like repeat-containing protein [Acidobacteriota bacterium]
WPICATAGGSELEVVAVEPPARSLAASVNTPVVIHFDRPVLPASIDSGSVRVFGRWSGAVSGDYVVSGDGQTLTIEPDRSFSAGESVMVVLSHDLEGADGSTLRGGGYSFQFWTRARAATVSFNEIGRLSTRVLPSQPSQAYGGIASDLDGDRWLDITIVNEITADLRVFMNRADGTGMLFDFIQPTFPVGDRASPSEPSDFNGDGIVDICVANIDADTVSILLGNGDGTFGPQQLIAVGDAPRGIAVLDVDGDGDTDVVNTNSGAGSGALNMSLMINDGSGVFGAPIFFKAGVAGPWALAAADMDEDGLLDLIVGARDAQLINVLGSRGDGTFQLLGSQAAGGQVWMLVYGDVDGDGHEDVAGINSFDNNGAILIGDGSGQLDPPQTYPTDPFVLASDLADLDGDGDLDWITS